MVTPKGFHWTCNHCLACDRSFSPMQPSGSVARISQPVATAQCGAIFIHELQLALSVGMVERCARAFTERAKACHIKVERPSPLRVAQVHFFSNLDQSHHRLMTEQKGAVFSLKCQIAPRVSRWKAIWMPSVVQGINGVI